MAQDLDNKGGSVSGELARDTSIEGVLYPQGTQITLDRGRLKYVRLVRPTRIHGILYTSSIPDTSRGVIQDNAVTFLDGKVVYGMLAETTHIAGNDFPPATLLSFSSTGEHLAEVTLQQPVVVRSVAYVGSLHLSEDGRVDYGWLATDTSLGSVTYKGRCPVEFWPSGPVKSGTAKYHLCVNQSPDCRPGTANYPACVNTRPKDCDTDRHGDPQGTVISGPCKFVTLDERGNLSGKIRSPNSVECLACN